MATTANNKKSILWVAQAGLLIALLVVVQLLTLLVGKSGVPLVSQLFTGTLVNLVLIVGAGSVGFSGTAVATVLSPVLALLFSQMPFPQMIPVVAIGNIVIVAVTWAFFKKGTTAFNIAGIAVGAVAKFAVLWATTVLLMVPVFFAGKPKIGKNLSLIFSWPQLITAAVGGILALIILPRIRSALSHKG